MRVILAGVFVFGGLLGFVALMSAFVTLESGTAIAAVSLAGIVVMFGLIAAAAWLFNPKGSDRFGRKSADQWIRELEEAGLLVATDFHATRAFAVEEFEDEGSSYFLELNDRRVLFLSGQYLYAYEPIGGQRDDARARRFPCTEFTVRRHATDRYVVDLICRGQVLEPEIIAPPFGKRDHVQHRVPEDGSILVDITYDELKTARAKPRDTSQ